MDAIKNCINAVKSVRWKAVMGKISLTMAVIGFFCNVVTTAPWDEFTKGLLNNNANLSSLPGTLINYRTQAAMSIISIGCGGMMVLLGICAIEKNILTGTGYDWYFLLDMRSISFRHVGRLTILAISKEIFS